MSLLTVPIDVLREIVGYLYYEHKFDISAIGALASTCKYMNYVMRLNSAHSPVTERDMARRKYINQLRRDPVIIDLFQMYGTGIYVHNHEFLLTALPYDTLIKVTSYPNGRHVITKNPLITIEILLDLIDRGLVRRDVKFHLSAKSIITARELASHGLECETHIVATIMQHYRRTGQIESFAPKSLLLECGSEYNAYILETYHHLVCDRDVPIDVLHKYRDKYNVTIFDHLESARWSADSEYFRKYVHESLNKFANDIIVCYECDIDFIVNNPQYPWNWEAINRRVDITTELIRKYPHIKWEYSLFDPISDYHRGSSVESQEQRINCARTLHEMCINGTITMDIILADPDVVWDPLTLLKISNIPIGCILEHYYDKMKHIQYMHYSISCREDITIEHIKRFMNRFCYLDKVKSLKKYISVNFT